MSCDVCLSAVIRRKYWVHNHATIRCTNPECNYVETGRPLFGIYVGMKDYFHVFNFDQPYYCPGCGQRGRFFYFPCGNAYYFDLNEIETTVDDEEY